MRRAVALALAFPLAGCLQHATLETGVGGDEAQSYPAPAYPAQGYGAAPYASAQSYAYQGDYAPHWCAVRAKYFHGLVAMPCDQIARTVAP